MTDVHMFIEFFKHIVTGLVEGIFLNTKFSLLLFPLVLLIPIAIFGSFINKN